MSGFSTSLIREAKTAAKGVIRPTPLVYSTSFSSLFGTGIYLKLENLRQTGSFKPRGAYNKRIFTDKEKKRGVIAASPRTTPDRIECYWQNLSSGVVPGRNDGFYGFLEILLIICFCKAVLPHIPG